MVADDAVTCFGCGEARWDSEFAHWLEGLICEFCYDQVDMTLLEWRDCLIEWYKVVLSKREAILALQQAEIATLPL